jgi:predicted membrane-bound mannosyltransferase
MQGKSMAQAAIQDHPTSHFSHMVDWLTVEHAGYGLVVLIGLGLRLWNLGATPLNPAEAMQALPAVTAVHGGVPDLSGVSPLLHSLQRITFSLFGASDGTARLWPALLGGLSPP